MITEKLLAEGLIYNIELNTGTSFESVVYSGMKYLNGKQILVFHTKNHKQLSINPSFHTFVLESELEESITQTKET